MFQLLISPGNEGLLSKYKKCCPPSCTSAKVTLDSSEVIPYPSAEHKRKWDAFTSGNASAQGLDGVRDAIEFRIQLKIGGTQRTIKEEYAYGFSQILGEIGGIWGLFLGVSVLSICEAGLVSLSNIFLRRSVGSTWIEFDTISFSNNPAMFSEGFWRKRWRFFSSNLTGLAAQFSWNKSKMHLFEHRKMLEDQNTIHYFEFTGAKSLNKICREWLADIICMRRQGRVLRLLIKTIFGHGIVAMCQIY